MTSHWQCLVVSGALLLTGCQGDDAPPTKKADGKTLFSHYCADCHGPSGNGKFLQGIPPNAKTRLTRQEVVNLLLYGRDDMPAMPKFRDRLTPIQAGKVADHLLFTLKNSD